MSSSRDKSDEVRKFKGTTIFEWDHEPSVLRDTGFEASTVPTADRLGEAESFRSSSCP